MERRKKVVKFRQRRNFNIGGIIFIIIFIYIGANVFLFFTKEHLSVYEVQAGTTADETVTQGIIIRDEKLVKTDTAGYISYYQKEGERVSKNSTLYSIDESKQVYEMMTNHSSFKMSDHAMDVIKKDVLRFMKKYSDVKYAAVTDFKYDIENTVTETMYETALDDIQDMMEEKGIVSGFKVVDAPVSGIVTYYYDNYENLKVKDVTADTFHQADLEHHQLRTSELIGADSTVCKIVKSDTWNIVCLLTLDQYEKMKDRERITVTLLQDQFTMTVPVSVYQSGDDYFAKLTLNRYMNNYLSDRFLDIQLHINKAEGLKIPKTAVTQKDFYVIPLTMFSEGGDTKELGIDVLSYNKNGEEKSTHITPKIYYKDDSYAYVSTSLFEYGTKLKSTKTQEVYQVTTTSSLQGVYNVNNGYFIFEKVDILYENKDYYIVKQNVPNSISVYDQIALNASKVIEDAILY